MKPLPDDLRQVTGEEVLVQAVARGVELLCVDSACDWHNAHSPGLLLRILAYSYATGCYYSEEIEELCHSSRVLQQLCDGAEVPSAAVLRLFRRTHHDEVARVLRALIQPALPDVALSARPEPLPDLLEHEVQRRLHAAMLADTGTLDV